MGNGASKKTIAFEIAAIPLRHIEFCGIVFFTHDDIEDLGNMSTSGAAKSNASFLDRYGAWAVIAGASEGLGAECATQIASRGVNCFLIARREELLARKSHELAEKYGIKTLYKAIDLEDANAANILDAETSALDVGLFVYNAGADPSGTKFLNYPIEKWRALVRRNVLTLMESTYLFAGRMSDKKKGGLLIIGSDAALGGGSRVCMYTATKGFGTNFAESLWAELKPLGVDVLNVIVGALDTPVFREALKVRNIPFENVSAANPVDVARLALENLSNGPDLIYWEHDKEGASQLAQSRRQHVIGVGETLQAFYGPE
ncbi:MAG: SDR family NAD(P)-dependent oxidoreductase [Alphaproteobacteria bacterium]|nr:SDR family NAD(P)-dependent oxidoreductase [Alphaproteobacteria bacterium]